MVKRDVNPTALPRGWSGSCRIPRVYPVDDQEAVESHGFTPWIVRFVVYTTAAPTHKRPSARRGICRNDSEAATDHRRYLAIPRPPPPSWNSLSSNVSGRSSRRSRAQDGQFRQDVSMRPMHSNYASHASHASHAYIGCNPCPKNHGTAALPATDITSITRHRAFHLPSNENRSRRPLAAPIAAKSLTPSLQQFPVTVHG